MPYNEHLNPESSCWISANAGTGKTKIVIDRILALLLSGTAPRNILAITFTNSAADEMMHRINDLIDQLTKYNKAELTKFLEGFFDINITNHDISKYTAILKKLEQEVTELKIQTIHSFCQSLLQEFNIEAGLKPGFNIIDENFSKIVLDEAREKIFDDEVIGDILNNLLSRYQYDYIADILDNVVSNRTKILYILGKYKNFREYIDKTYSFLKIEQIDSPYDHIFTEFFDHLDIDFLSQLKTAIESFGSKKDSGKLPILTALIMDLESQTKHQCFIKFQKIFCKKDNSLLKAPFTKNVSNKIDDYENIFSNISTHYQHAYNLYNKYDLAKISIDMLIIAQFFLQSYENIKHKHNLLDYEDLILKSLELLKTKAHRDFILYKLDFNISHLLVDEAQDISPWQWEIIKLLLEDFFATKEKGKSFFIVGDEKQSIYSFQGADHQLFGNIKNEFSQKLKYKGEVLHQINLNTSYRSGAPILHLVDKVSNKENIKPSLTIGGNSEIKHHCFRKNINSRVVLWPEYIQEKPQDTFIPWRFPKEIVKKTSPYDDIAKGIVNFIKDVLSDDRISESTNRKIIPSDIMILSRKRSNLYKAIIRNLSQANINVESDIRIEMLDHVLIMDLVSIIKFISFPEDSLNLASLLKSPIFDFSEDDIFNLCHGRETSVSLYEVLKKYKDGISNEDQKNSKLCGAYNKLEELVSLSTRFNIEEFFLYLIEKYNLREKYYIIFGKQTNTFINLFLQVVQAFEKHNSNYLEFLEYILRSKISVQSEITNNEESVKILSIHASKGLQSPIVILATETYGKNSFKKNFFNFDYQNNLIFGNFSTITSEYKDYFDKFSTDKSAEELRLLYVALTRARDELHIFSFRNNNSDSDWYSIIKNSAEEIKEFTQEPPTRTEVITEGKQDECLIYEVNLGQKLDSTTKSNKTQKDTNTILQINNSNELFRIISNSYQSPAHQPVVTATSSNSSNSNSAYIGTIYHSLFYYLSEYRDHITFEQQKGQLPFDQIIDNSQIDNKLTKFLENYHSDLTKKERKTIISNMIKVYNNEHFNELFFSKDGYSELHLLSKKNGKTISGKIDRVVNINDGELHIIDYKFSTNNEITPSYKSQLNIYKQLVADNFPNKKIKTFLFFINNQTLVEIH